MVYGYVNGEAVSSRDEFVYKCRRLGPIDDDQKLIEFAKKVTHNWLDAGWNRTFATYYLGDYALDHPKRDLTDKEYARLKELQKEERAKLKAADGAREWKLVGRYCYADNSVEEVWVDKGGIKKTVMVEYPHGD